MRNRAPAGPSDSGLLRFTDVRNPRSQQSRRAGPFRKAVPVMSRMFDNLRMWQKALLPLLVMALMTLAVSVYMVSGMKRIDDSYSDLIDREAHGAVWAARGNSTLIDLGSTALRILGATDAPEAIDQIKSLAPLQQQFNERFGQVRQAVDDPAVLAKLRQVETGFAEAHGVAEEIGKLIVAGESAAAQVMMDQKFKPVIDHARPEMRAVVETLVSTMEARSGATSAHADTIRVTAMAILAGAIVISVLLGLWIAMTGMVRPVSRLNLAMGGLARGDWSIEVPGTARRDELGAMARTVEVFKTNGIAAETQRAEQDAEQQRQIDRGVRIETRVAAFEAVIAGVVNTVSSASTELESTAQAMASTAEETTRQSSTVAAASEQATENVQMVAAATEELSASVREIGQQVTNSSSMIREAVQQADRSNEQVRGLTTAAEKIGDVVKIISDIAGQTNLLALNATIEAARAGDAGKGFAVVASEVKALANQTARATEDIRVQIDAIQHASRSSAQSIQDIAATISRVNEAATMIASAVEQQGAATQEIARNVAQAAQGTQDVSGTIGGVSQAAQETGAAAAQVLASAGELSRNGEALSAQVQAFLAEVRAA
jgi:methyl-accepting chemotaxis protein